MTFEAEAFLSIMRAADALSRKLEEVLKQHSLSPTQYNVLRILRGAGENGYACGEIGNRMLTRDPDMTRLLDRMEQRKLISRHRQTEDRRVVCTKVTVEGLNILADLDQPVLALHRSQFGHLNGEELRKLIALLEAVRTGKP